MKLTAKAYIAQDLDKLLDDLVEYVKDYQEYKSKTTSEERFKDTSKWNFLWKKFNSFINLQEIEEQKDFAIKAMEAWENGDYGLSLNLLRFMK